MQKIGCVELLLGAGVEKADHFAALGDDRKKCGMAERNVSARQIKFCDFEVAGLCDFEVASVARDDDD